MSAIVVTFNRKKLLVQCLSKLLMQTKEIKKIYIVDNASTDGTNKYLKELKFLGNKK